MEIKDVFSAQPVSAWQLLCQQGEGFYIPAYQRPYSWDEENIDRLFEDVTHGIMMLTMYTDAITFLGAIIVIHDTKYETVAPHCVGQLPAKVKVVIDGQQRLSTLLIASACLSDQIKLRADRFASGEEPHVRWAYQKSLESLSQLRKACEQDMDYGENEFRWYPRIIRAYVDSWSREADDAQYTSPISRFLHEYSKHSRIDPYKRFAFKKPEGLANAEAAQHGRVVANMKHMRKILKLVAEGDSSLEIPSLGAIAGNDDFQKELFNSSFPPEVSASLGSDTNEKSAIRFRELVRLLVFCRFLLERVCVTFVTAKNEVYAFDMFEALNTTGEPLTAFETFRPLVISSEGLSKYETSPSRVSIEKIEGYLNAFKKAPEKQKATTGLLIPFALANNGYKLSTKLSEQRKYLRDQYEALPRISDDANAKREFVHSLAHTSQFIQSCWPPDKRVRAKIPGLSHNVDENDALLCLEFLRSAKHEITISLLSRYFSELQVSGADSNESASHELVEVLKATVAFFVLWRSSRPTTENIDSLYRTMMKEGVSATQLPPLARSVDGAQDNLPSAGVIQDTFRYFLKEHGGIENYDDYGRKVSSVPIYKNKTVARFLLFLSSQDTEPDPSNDGLVTIGRTWPFNMLTPDGWADDEMTIEHIAPRTKSEGWPDKLYEDGDTIHYLGNLALVPKRENAALSNRSWEHKRLIYEVLSASTTEEVDQSLDEAKKLGIPFSSSTEGLLKGAKILPQLKAIGNVSDTWSLELISSRTERLCQLAWNRLESWIGWPR